MAAANADASARAPPSSPLYTEEFLAWQRANQVSKLNDQSKADGSHHVYRGRHQSLTPAFSMSDQGDGDGDVDTKGDILAPASKLEEEQEAALQHLAEEEELIRLANEANARAQQEALDWQKKYGAAAMIPYESLNAHHTTPSRSNYASTPTTSASSSSAAAAAAASAAPPYLSPTDPIRTPIPKGRVGKAITEAATAANRAAAAALDPADFPDRESYSRAKWILTANDRTRARSGKKNRADDRKSLADKEARSSRGGSSSIPVAPRAASAATARAQQEVQVAGQRRRRREDDEDAAAKEERPPPPHLLQQLRFQQQQHYPSRPYVGSAYYQWYSAGGNFEGWAAMHRARSDAVRAFHQAHGAAAGGQYGVGWWGAYR